MNIWSLNKSFRLKHLLLLLEQQLGDDSYVLDTTTPTNDAAIYLNHKDEPTVRAYVFTLGQDEDRYGVHLEFLNFNSPGQQPIEIYENLKLSSLVQMLAVHLDIGEIKPLPNSQ